MFELVPRYTIGILTGICLGLIWPFLASWWLVVYLLAAFAINELAGRWCFGSHWDGYRPASYLLYGFPCGIIALGILLGSGGFGRFLILIGQTIS